MHKSHSTLIIKLPARYLCKLLQKLRNPEKHDAIDRLMFSLLDNYERNYLQLKTTYTRKPRRK
ncbi:mdtC domain protein [Pseudomonas fitomaticsae]|uniref:MdtC domain protein n=2 Tax=Pseudomonas fitomaticsae TaxID=2837969 RepID=A0ABY3QA44_9PSED|nr:mdtC domain protein [Pseudomonas fitomaticsae]